MAQGATISTRPRDSRTAARGFTQSAGSGATSVNVLVRSANGTCAPRTTARDFVARVAAPTGVLDQPFLVAREPFDLFGLLAATDPNQRRPGEPCGPAKPVRFAVRPQRDFLPKLRVGVEGECNTRAFDRRADPQPAGPWCEPKVDVRPFHRGIDRVGGSATPLNGQRVGVPFEDLAVRTKRELIQAIGHRADASTQCRNDAASFKVSAFDEPACRREATNRSPERKGSLWCELDAVKGSCDETKIPPPACFQLWAKRRSPALDPARAHLVWQGPTSTELGRREDSAFELPTCEPDGAVRHGSQLEVHALSAGPCPDRCR